MIVAPLAADSTQFFNYLNQQLIRAKSPAWKLLWDG
jgi:hypothetical protein